ncbi:helix-turn-helix domain-containing protein [Roseibacillus persicicus]|uniref:TetR/AcrR family transcriptional regulator n=1 Tax=Roseibacillus persicicus TaxID=454148 RepID=UPI00398B032F
MTPEIEKQNQVLDAALEVFLRYGFKKATMGDIADKAGMSRPSLYLVFANKEDIFRAVITRKEEEFCQETDRKFLQCRGLRERLTAVLETWILEPFTLVSASPQAEEILEFAYTFAPDLRKQMLESMESKLLEAMSADSQDISDKDRELSRTVLARLIAVSTIEMKHSITLPSELQQLLEATVEVHASYLEKRD